MSNEPTVKLWTAKRTAAVVMDIFKGKTTVAEVALEEALVHRFGALGRIHQPLALRSDKWPRLQQSGLYGDG